jgi:hypothetical protein
MTQPTSVIYLPPGVVPAAPATPAGAGIPFNRQFFEAFLPQAVNSFCTQVQCDIPRVEIYTADGATLYVNGISGVTDLWVALHTAREDHSGPVEVFLPYQTIFRVEIHPESNASRHHLGFVAPPEAPPAPAVQAPVAQLVTGAKRTRPAKAKK